MWILTLFLQLWKTAFIDPYWIEIKLMEIYNTSVNLFRVEIDLMEMYNNTSVNLFPVEIISMKSL